MSTSPHSRSLAVATVVGVVATGTLMYYSNQKTKSVSGPASMYGGTESGASKPLGSAADHTSDQRMSSSDVREHISGGKKP